MGPTTVDGSSTANGAISCCGDESNDESTTSSSSSKSLRSSCHGKSLGTKHWWQRSEAIEQPLLVKKMLFVMYSSVQASILYRQLKLFELDKFSFGHFYS